MRLYQTGSEWSTCPDVRTMIIRSFVLAPCIVRPQPYGMFTVIPVQFGPRFPGAPALAIDDNDMYVPYGPHFGQTIH